MGKTTIEWTSTISPDGTVRPGYSFNPWVGCTKVSPGCEHCYAEAWAKRAGRDFSLPTRTTPANWRQPLKWDREAATAGERRRVFCASLADVFDNQVPPAWRADLFRLIRQTPNLDWLLLTKRIGNATEMIDRALTEDYCRSNRSTQQRRGLETATTAVGHRIVEDLSMEKHRALLKYKDAPPSVSGLEVQVYLASDVDARIAELEKSSQRYEKLRKLDPRQFHDLWLRSIALSERFDDLVDRLPS